MRRQPAFEYRNCRQCGSLFKVSAADLEEETDWRYCSDDCERISKELDAAEVRREEREDP